jgi:transposase-like protein
MTCLRCQHDGAKRFGTYGRLRIQRYRCNSCRSTFTQPRRKPLGRHSIEIGKAVQVVTLLTEGMSVRAVTRITGVHKTTILSLLQTVGEKCRRVFDARVRIFTAGDVENSTIGHLLSLLMSAAYGVPCG